MTPRCSEVEFTDKAGPAYLAGLGDCVWNPKAGEGHVMVAEVPCEGGLHDCGCGGWLGPCSYTTLLCECGEDSSCRDHHYALLARG